MSVFIHPCALVESESIGEGTKIWAHAHVMNQVVIGTDCNIGDNVFIESGATVGCGVTIKNNVLIWKGVHIGNYAFIGPNVVFTNDRQPRSPRMPLMKAKGVTEKEWLVETHVEEGASIGASATILPGVRLGHYCMIGAGSVVTQSVPPYMLVVGNPARIIGKVDETGKRID